MSDFVTLYTDVLNHGFGSTQFTQYAKDMLNDAQQQIAARFDLRVLAATPQSTNLAAGSFSYNLPTDFLRARFLENTTDGWVMQPFESYESLEIADEAGTYTATGSPSFYVIEAGTVKVYPTPSATTTLKLYYYRTPATLSADADVPEIPATYHRSVLVAYAVAMCFRREGDTQQASFFQSEYERELDRMAVQLQYDGYEGPRQVAGAW